MILALFFLHHLPDELLAQVPAAVARLLAPGGSFYSLDPNRYRLSGAVGKIVVPSLMKRYQTEDERELDPGATAALFRGTGFEAKADYYDFLSSPMAGLFPGWRLGYQATRAVDELLRRVPLLRGLGSNFEIIAHKSR